MKVTSKVGLAAALSLAAGLLAPVSAADLYGGYKGSIKDGPYAAPQAAAGPCYFRADTGYSWSQKPSADYVGNQDPNVWNESLGNGWLVEAGIGCGSGSRGLRGELVIGHRESRKFHGDTEIFINNNPVDPRLHTDISTTTLMFNAFYDLGSFHGLVPYVGAGAGWAYHRMGDVRVDSPLSPNPQLGEDKLSFAWALMAGAGYQLSSRAILDVGYRYIDMGLARSSHGDVVNAWNPRLEVDDMRAHEFKIGIRYHFGSSCCDAPVPLK